MGEILNNRNFRGRFQAEVEKASHQKFADCYQCGKCSAGCPMAGYMDLVPSSIMRAVQLNQAKKTLGCRTIWLCASCETCTTRCPKEIDIARVMDTLREMSLARGTVHPEMKDVTALHKVFLESLRRGGRLFEAGMIGSYKIRRPGHLFDDLGHGLSMGLKGKLKPLPHLIKGRKSVKRIFKKCK